MLQQNIKAAVNVSKNGEPVEDLCIVWDNLAYKELARVERSLTNSLTKLNDLAELGIDMPAGTDTSRGKVELDFTVWNDEGEEAAWTGIRYTGMTNTEIDFTLGIIRGELDKMVDKTIEKKSKKVKTAKTTGGTVGGVPGKK